MENCIREYKGNSRLDMVSEYVVVDIETTGYSPSLNEITEIGAIKVKNNEICDTYHFYIQIENDIPYHIKQLTGITNEILQNEGIPVHEAISDFTRFIGDQILVGHNVNFDINFLYDHSMKYLNKAISNDFIDTLRIAKSLIKDVYNYKLSTLTKRLNTPYDTKHRALADVYATNELYQKLSYLKDNYISIRLNEIAPYLKETSLFTNKKVSIKSQLKYLDHSLLTAILEKFNTKTYDFLSRYADILIVNDHTYQKLQVPLSDDPYLQLFHPWMLTAQERIMQNTLTMYSETQFCEILQIPIPTKIEKEMDINSPLYDKVCVFTGTLERMSRKQAETIVASIGGVIGNGVTKNTSYLILGNNDYNFSIKNGKSSKHQKAEDLQAQGYDIEIIPEDAFYEMIGED